MTSRLLIAGVALGCVTAAGLGGFLAVRTATHSSEAAALTPQATASTTGAEAAVASPATPLVTASEEPAAQPARDIPRAVRPAAAPESDAHSPASTAAGVPEPVVTPPPVLSVDTSPSAIAMHPGPSVSLPAPRAELVELPANAVIGIRLDTTVSSETARVEDTVHARVSRPVVVDGVTVIPTGARLTGSVTVVERGGRFRERSRIGIQFTSVTIDDDRHIPIRTEGIYRVGEAPTGEATAKIGASAVVGSILGGVFGGKKGAAIGAATGAAGGTAIVAADGPNEAVLASGATFTLRLSEPATFEVGR
ncbi:MAG: hypothetical protein IT183_11655 [Acidobacteria bacterium]|nr:hypothetical protein [Acidobacteriota bacterium]